MFEYLAAAGLILLLVAMFTGVAWLFVALFRWQEREDAKTEAKRRAQREAATSRELGKIMARMEAEEREVLGELDRLLEGLPDVEKDRIVSPHTRHIPNDVKAEAMRRAGSACTAGPRRSLPSTTSSRSRAEAPPKTQRTSRSCAAPITAGSVIS